MRAHFLLLWVACTPVEPGVCFQHHQTETTLEQCHADEVKILKAPPDAAPWLSSCKAIP
jgi:hypothetical protein